MIESGTYGQFGRAIYDHESKIWKFQRSTKDQACLKQFEEPKVVIPPTVFVQLEKHRRDGKEGLSRRREKQVKSLAQTHPELQPASTLLPDFARVSEAVEDTTARHDPAKGDLLALGSITDERQRRLVEVAAFPFGPTGSDLRIMQVQKQRRGWSDSRNVWLEGPTIFGEGATWKGSGVPIQSIAFARPFEEGDHLLAVRMVTKSLVFRPILRKLAMPHGSRLDANMVFDLNVDKTGGLPHADVVFNPWNTRQFAVVDQAGDWSIWEIGVRNSGRAKRICQGQLSGKTNSSQQRLLDDGWARIIWVCDPTIVAVCNRRHLTIFDVGQEESLELQRINLDVDKKGDWTLDMRVLWERHNYLTILTCTHVLIYHVDSSGEDGIGAKLGVKLRHFRNSEDVSLRMHVFGGRADNTVIIRSEASSAVVGFRIDFSDPDRISMGDLTDIKLPLAESQSPAGLGVLALQTERLLIKRNENTAINTTGLRYLDQGVQFYVLSTLAKDLSVRQTLYVRQAASHQSSELESLSWERELTKSVPRMLEDDFIVDDDEEDEMSIISATEPAPSYAIRRRNQASSRSGDDWTVNFELTERNLNNLDVSEVTDVFEVFEEARSILQRGKMDQVVSIRTFQDLAEGELTLRDVTEASAALEDLRSLGTISRDHTQLENEDAEAPESPKMGLYSLAMPQTARLTALQRQHPLSRINADMLETWITPLANDVSDIVRLSREQLALRVAAAVALASQVIRLEEVKEDPPPHDTGESQGQNQTWELPVRQFVARSPSRTTPSVYLDASSQSQSPGLPTPSASDAVSVTTASSRLSTLSAPEISRLNRYTTFSGKAPTPALPRRLNRVLKHWVPGADPDTYDWLTASRHVSRRDEEEAVGEELTEKERERMHRRAERYVRRQRREAEQRQRHQMLSSQAPEIMTASKSSPLKQAESQPARRAGDSQSQSQDLAQAIASQVLPGRHGGRPSAKKKRKVGF